MRTPLLCLLLAAAAPAAAQEAAAPETAASDLPPWVVPVLRLVSETHVRPTTGIVLSGAGLVLVPADFAAVGDEVVVLDGGTDIVRHGRPARLHSAYPELGLEVLTVPGLSRAGAPIATERLAEGDTVRLRAFPPAEQIAEGALPVEVTARVALLRESGSPAILPGTPLPNVTGPLLDACGNLAGISMAGGAQTMAPSAATEYRWLATLRQVLESLQLSAEGLPCDKETAGEMAAETPETAEPEAVQVPVTETPPAEPEPPEADEPALMQSEPALDLLPPHEDDTAQPAPDGEKPADKLSSTPSWWWLAGGLLLLGGGLVMHRLRRDSTDGEAAEGAPISGAPDDVGPSGPPGTRTPVTAPESQLDSRLLLRGQYADGRPLEAAIRVSANAVNLEIGRGGADLVLDSMAVSRRHARLNGTRSALTIADLGSSNGTSIDGIPCLEGEIMYLEPDCTVVLGDARFEVSIEPETGAP